MKNYYLYLVLFVQCLSNVFGQNTSAYLNSKFNIRPVSTDVLGIINKQLKISNKDLERKQKELNFSFSGNRIIGQQFANLFNRAYAATLNDIKKYDYLAAIPNNVENVGLINLRINSYNSLPTSLDKFLPPNVKYNADVVLEQYVIAEFKSSKEQVDLFIKSRFQLIKDNASGIDLSVETNYDAFKKKFCATYGELKELIINYDSLLLRNHINEQISIRAFEIRNEFSKSVTDARIEFEQATKRINAIKATIEKEVQLIPDYLDRLAKNQKLLDSLISQQQSIVNKKLIYYKNEINKTEKELEEKTKNGINELDNKTKREVELLKTRYNELRNKINTVSTFVGNLTTGKFDLKQGLDFIKNEAVKKILGADARDIEISFNAILVGQNIEKNAKTFCNVAYNLTNNLVGLGVINGDVALAVSGFIKYTSAALDIGSGFGELFSLNPIGGIVKIFSGIKSLFGGEPEESPEQKMLKQIDGKLNEVLKRLSAINENLVKISGQITDLHKSMNESFNEVFRRLDLISYKLNTIQELARLQVYGEFNACDVFIDDTIFSRLKFETWDDYKTYHTTETGICLSGLNRFSLTKDEGYFYLQTSKAIEEEENTTKAVLNVFGPTHRLFKLLYPSGSIEANSNALNGLALPVQRTSDVNLPYFYACNNYVELTFSNIEKLFNASLVSRYVSLFHKLSPYFEMSLSDPNFKPDDIEDYLGIGGDGSWLNSQRVLKNQLQRNRVQKIIKITNKAIIQQNLLAGGLLLDHVCAILENYAASDSVQENALRLVDTVLFENKYLASNLATKILSREFDVALYNGINSYDTSIVSYYTSLQEFNDSISIYKREVEERNISTDFLNKKLNEGKIRTAIFDTMLKSNGRFLLSFQFVFDSVEVNNKLEILPAKFKSESYRNKNKYLSGILLDLPPVDVVLRNNMMYPDEMYELLDAKNLLKDQLVALTFNEKLPKLDLAKVKSGTRGNMILNRESFKAIYNYNEIESQEKK